MKPKWKAWLFEMSGQSVAWKYVEYVDRDRAIRTARECANMVAFIKQGRMFMGQPPIEDKLDNGGVIFRIPGVTDYNRWPRVEPIDAD